MQQFDEYLSRQISPSFLRGTTITIPVIVHIVKHQEDETVSDETVFSQIDALNRDFNAHNPDLNKVPQEFKKYIATSGIRFCITNKDTNGNATNGILRIRTNIKVIGLKDSLFDTKLGGSTAWNSNKYLNIWVANTGEYITGIGSFPNLVPANKSGVVIHPRYFGKNSTSKFGLGRVAVHEVGHFFGLYHTWGKVTDTICSTDDEVADTPLQLLAYSGCPNYPQYSCGLSSLFMNFMDYVNDPCMLMFTEGQMQRMLTTIATYRAGLLHSIASCAIDSHKDIDCFVFPNPTAGQIKINWKIGSNTEGGTIRLINGQGQQIFQHSILTETDDLVLDLPNISNGLYLLSIEIIGKNVSLQKIIIAK